MTQETPIQKLYIVQASSQAQASSSQDDNNSDDEEKKDNEKISFYLKLGKYKKFKYIALILEYIKNGTCT